MPHVTAQWFFFFSYTEFLNINSLSCLFLSCEAFKSLFWGMSHSGCVPHSQFYPLPPCFVVVFRSIALQRESLLQPLCQQAPCMQLVLWFWDQQQFKMDHRTGSLAFQTFVILCWCFPLQLFNIHLYLKALSTCPPCQSDQNWIIAILCLYYFPHYIPKPHSFPPPFPTTPPPQHSESFMEFHMASHPL